LHLSFRDAVTPSGVIEQEASPWSRIDLSGTLAEVTRRAVTEVERRKIEQVMKDAGGNRGRAAEILQVSFKSLLGKLKEHGLDAQA
jgi:two-component system response regulator AtoC